MAARDFFVQVRDDVARLAVVQAKLEAGGEDWRPDSVRTGNGDPTAARAVYNLDTLAGKLESLRSEERDLLETIGRALAVIEGVRKGLGDEYASILDQRYIDGLPWRFVEYGGETVSPSTGKRKAAVAFDWIDSVGFAGVIAGKYEL